MKFLFKRHRKMNTSNENNYTFQLLLLGNVGEHQADFKGGLEVQLRKLGLDMDKLVTFPATDKFVKRNCPALAIYLGVKPAADDTEEEKKAMADQRKRDEGTMRDLRVKGIPVLELSGDDGVVDKSQVDYSQWAGKALLYMGLQPRKKVWVNYADDTPDGLRRALFDVLQTRHYEVREDRYRLGNLSQEVNHKDFSDWDVLIFFHMPGSVKDSWVRQRLAYAARLQIGVLEVMLKDEIPSYGSLGSIVTLDELWSPCCGCRTMAARLVDRVDSLWVGNWKARMDNLSGTLQEYQRQNIRTNWELQPGYVIASELYGRLHYQVPVCVTRAESFDDALVQAKTLLPDGTKNDEIELVYDSLYTNTSDDEYQKRLHGYAAAKILDVHHLFRLKPCGVGTEKHILLLASLPSPQKDVDTAYLQTIDRLAVRDALRAFFSLLPSGVCVHLAGHPVWGSLVESIGKWRQATNNVKTYIPESGQGMYEWVEGARTHWDAVVVIGGGATEFPVALNVRSETSYWLPVAATGGAAKILCDQHEKSIQVPNAINPTDLRNGKTNMQSLFHDLFKAL